MSERYRVLALMTGAQVGASVVQQAVGALAPFLIADFAISNAQLGLLFTALYGGSMCFTMITGVLTDRLGERVMLLWSSIAMAAALVASTFVHNYVWFVVWIGIFGAGYAASTPAGGRAILAWFTVDRGFAMGIRQTGVPFGGLIGAIVLPLVALHFGGYRAAMIVAAVLLLVPSLIAYVVYQEVPVDRTQSAGVGELFRGMGQLARDPRIIVVTLTCMVLVSVQLSVNGFLTLTAIRDAGFTANLAALAFACAQLFATFGRIFWGWFSDARMRGERIRLLAAISALASVAAFAVAAITPATAIAMVPLAALIGLSGAGWNGVMAAGLAEIGGAHRAGSALGLALTAVFGASAVAPAAFGAISDHTSLHVAWACTGVLAACGVLPAIWLARSDRDGPRCTLIFAREIDDEQRSGERGPQPP